MTLSRSGPSELSTDPVQTVTVRSSTGSSNQSGGLFKWVDYIFGNTGVLHRVILSGTGVLILGVFYRNIAPYSALMARVFSDGGGAPNILSTIAGIAVFSAVQAAEVLPLAVPRNRSDLYRVSKFVSWVAFGWDFVACFHYFPPIRVSFDIFRFAPSFSGLDWGNLVLLLVTVFGLTLWVMLRNEFAKSYGRRS